jgi:signal transduction histidine kinase
VLAADGSRWTGRRTRRDWVVDSVVFAVVGLSSALALVLAADPVEGSGFRRPSGLEVGVDLAVGLAAMVALWWRRRFPVLLGVVTAFAAVVSSFAGGAAFVMLLTVAIHRRWPWSLLVGGANLVAAVLFLLWWGDGTLPRFAWAIVLAFAIALVAAVIGFGMFIRARRQLLASLRERAERAEAEQQRAADAARQGERTRIAREMHDVLAHRISLVSMHAGALEYSRDAGPDEVAMAAGVIRDNAHRALEDLREVIGVLREVSADDADGTAAARPQPTLADLDALVEQTRAAGVPVELVEDVADDTVPLTTGRTAYRVLQEGLTNARKHGEGAKVHVRVSGRPGDGLELEVRNAMRPARMTVAPGGEPLPPVPGAGVGLVGLAERARLAGGRAEHGVVAGGFRLHVWLPWTTEATT